MGSSGSNSRGLIQRICNDFGNEQSAKFIDDLQNIVTEYMKISGYSVGIGDLISDDKTKQDINKIINEKKKEVKKKGITKVVCISINDPFVMEAWGKSYNLKKELTLLADTKGDFTKSIGATFNWRGWGYRSKRYTMLLESGVIKKLVEEEGKCELTAAENFLKEI